VANQGVAGMIGIDLVEVDRIQKIIEKYGDKFLKKFFTDREILYCNYSQRLRYQRFAARFAAKEALVKALGERAFPWTDIEIAKDETDRPDFELYGQAAQYANEHGVVDVYVSLSHTKTMAAAQVLLVVDEEGYYQNGDVQVYFKDEDEDEDEDEEAQEKSG
jgi:holo-[acyl-carrier protein] synthase